MLINYKYRKQNHTSNLLSDIEIWGKNSTDIQEKIKIPK